MTPNTNLIRVHLRLLLHKGNNPPTRHLPRELPIVSWANDRIDSVFAGLKWAVISFLTLGIQSSPVGIRQTGCHPTHFEIFVLIGIKTGVTKLGKSHCTTFATRLGSTVGIQDRGKILRSLGVSPVAANDSLLPLKSPDG